MNDIYVYSLQSYEKQISHDYYCQIITHEVCHDVLHKPIFGSVVFTSLELIFDLSVIHGMVCSSSLVSIILSFLHFLLMNMISCLSYV
jgi:hypothetical protein